MTTEAGHVNTTPPQSEKSEGHKPEEGAQNAGAEANAPDTATAQYERLLKEAKANKAEAQRLKAENAKLKQATSQKETDFKAKYEQLEANWMKASIAAAVKTEAAKRGMHNPERALNLIGTGQINFDLESGDVSGVEDFFDTLQASDPYLFKSKGTGVNGAAPGGSAPAKPKDKLDSLREELKNALGRP